MTYSRRSLSPAGSPPRKRAYDDLGDRAENRKRLCDTHPMARRVFEIEMELAAEELRQAQETDGPTAGD